MKGNEQSSLFNEAEVIQITIDNGYDGSEFKTVAWKERGCLKPNGTLKALTNKLETIYNHVEVTGSGKKRKYILTDKKQTITERKFNYKGTVLTPEDETMTEYIFNILLTYPDGFNKSFKGWAKLIGFIETNSLSIDEMIKEIKNLHHNFPTIYNPKEAVSIFLQTLNNRNKNIIERSFHRLEKENRITVTEIFNLKYTDGTYEIINQKEYDDIFNYIKLFLEAKGITYYNYSQSLTSIHKSKKMEQIINDVDEYLSNYFGIEYFFKSFKINVVDRASKGKITFDEFNAAYFQKLIKLTEARQNKKSYIDSIIFWKRFYLFNTFTLLKYIKAPGANELLKEHRKQYLHIVDTFHLDRMKYYFDSDVKKEEIRHSFGNN